MEDSKWQTTTGKTEPQMTSEDVVKLPTYTKSSDDQGHSISLSTRVPNQLARIASEQIASPDTPYKTRSDYFRDALFHFAFLCELKYSSGDTGVEARRLMAIEHHRVRLADRVRLRGEAKKYAEQIAALCRTGAEEDLHEAGRSVSEMAESLEGDDYASCLYLGHLRQVHAGQLLRDQIPEDVRTAIEQASIPPRIMEASSGLSGAALDQLQALTGEAEEY